MPIKSNNGILAYKVFSRKVTQGETKVTTTCGHSGCTQHVQKVQTQAETVLLKGAYTENTTLQKVGDKASLPANLGVKICARGWHATTPAYIKSWTSLDEWRAGRKTVFLVRLRGDIERGRDKIAARHIEMLEEIPYKSKQGDRLRALIVKQQQAQAAREKARDKAFNARRKAAREKQRLLQKARDLHNRKVKRAVRAHQLKVNRVRRELQLRFNKQRRELVKRLGGYR